MIFCHVWTWNQDNRLSDKLEFTDRTCTSTANNKVGSLICSTHITDKVHYLQVWKFLTFHGIQNLLMIELTRLPDELNIRLLNEVKVFNDWTIDSSCSEATTNEEDCFLIRGKTEALTWLFNREWGREYVLTNRVTRHDNLISREETLHTFVSNANLLHTLWQ